MTKQKTLNTKVYASGVGIHSNKEVNFCLSPAPANSGIIFRVNDNNTFVDIPATLQYIEPSPLFITLSKNSVRLVSVETLLASLYAFGIDNVIVELDGNELPASDGSASLFAFLIKSAGIKELEENKKYLKLKQAIICSEGESYIRLTPSDEFRVTCKNSYTLPVICNGPQTYTYSNTTSFEKDLSRSRRFFMQGELLDLQKSMLYTNANLSNALILSDDLVLNEDGIRFVDEFVRASVAKTLAHISLLSMGLFASYTSYKANHNLNLKLLETLLKDKNNYEVVSNVMDESGEYSLASIL